MVPCYNYGNYLAEAIESVVSQTYRNIEILIIDDGSTDNSQQVASNLVENHKNVTYIRNDNQGVVRTRNLGIDLAKGEFVVFLDADDVLDNNYIEETVKCAETNNADIVYTNVRRFGEEEYTTDFPDFTLEELKNHNFIQISSLIRKSAIEGVRFDENLNGMTHEDWDFFLNLCAHDRKAMLCRTTFLNYRIHQSARNNRFGNYIDQRKYIDVYAYVIDKYRKELPKQFDYLTGRVFANWYAAIDDERTALDAKNARLRSQRDISAIKLYGAERQLELITNSKKYKFTENLSLLIHPKEMLKKSYRRFKKITDKTKLLDKQNVKLVNEIYDTNYSNAKDTMRSKDAKLAVVIHLYYPDMWDEFQQQLSKIDHLNFDLFISIPSEGSIRDKIKKSYPKAFIYIAPNRGRDVLPFIWIMQFIKNMNYSYVLKLHSKKSKHRHDGNIWFKQIINTLIPQEKNKLDKIIKRLSDDDTAIIGPKHEYVSLEVNYEQNKHYFNKLLSDFEIDDIRKELHNYGFFAGTMFWARVDAFDNLLNKNYGPKDFQLEAGQIDGTFAHGLERIFCVLPESKHKKVYSLDTHGLLAQVEYSSGKIPEWSDLHAENTEQLA